MKYKNTKEFNVLISENEVSKIFYPIKKNSIWELIRKSTEKGILFYTLQENIIHGDLIMVCDEYMKNFEVVKEDKSYLGFYSQVESTYGFYEALKIVCKKHNLTKAIYEYAQNMNQYDSDLFDDDLCYEYSFMSLDTIGIRMSKIDDYKIIEWEEYFNFTLDVR